MSGLYLLRYDNDRTLEFIKIQTIEHKDNRTLNKNFLKLEKMMKFLKKKTIIKFQFIEANQILFLHKYEKAFYVEKYFIV